MTDQGTLKLHVVTPERELFSSQVASVGIPGSAGEAQILPGHARAIVDLKPGALVVSKTDQSIEYFCIAGGYAEVNDNTVTVLADAAEHATEIDMHRAETARDSALQMLSGKGETDDEFQRELAHFKRAVARITVASVTAATKH
jgi:F-type H+-transporting ATPase subunit epsilon